MLFTTDKALTRATLQDAARRIGQPELAVARTIIVLDELPVLGTGKIDYLQLKRMAETAQAA